MKRLLIPALILLCVAIVVCTRLALADPPAPAAAAGHNTVESLEIEGNEVVSTELVRQQVYLKVGDEVNDAIIKYGKQSIEGFYKGRGFRDVEVTPHNSQGASPESRVVIYRVKEGQQSPIAAPVADARAGVAGRSLAPAPPRAGSQSWSPTRPLQVTSDGTPVAPDSSNYDYHPAQQSPMVQAPTYAPVAPSPPNGSAIPVYPQPAPYAPTTVPPAVPVVPNYAVPQYSVPAYSQPPQPSYTEPVYQPAAPAVYSVRVQAVRLNLQMLSIFSRDIAKLGDAQFEEALRESDAMAEPERGRSLAAMRGKDLTKGPFAFSAGDSGSAIDMLRHTTAVSDVEDLSLLVESGRIASSNFDHEIPGTNVDNDHSPSHRTVGLCVKTKVEPRPNQRVRVEVRPRLSFVGDESLVHVLELDSVFEMALGETLVLASINQGQHESRLVLLVTVASIDTTPANAAEPSAQARARLPDPQMIDVALPVSATNEELSKVFSFWIGFGR